MSVIAGTYVSLLGKCVCFTVQDQPGCLDLLLLAQFNVLLPDWVCFTVLDLVLRLLKACVTVFRIGYLGLSLILYVALCVCYGFNVFLACWWWSGFLFFYLHWCESFPLGHILSGFFFWINRAYIDMISFIVFFVFVLFFFCCSITFWCGKFLSFISTHGCPKITCPDIGLKIGIKSGIWLFHLLFFCVLLIFSWKRRKNSS